MSDSSPHHYQVYPSIPDGCPFVKYELRGWCRHVVLWGSTVGTPDHEPYPMDPILWFVGLLKAMPTKISLAISRNHIQPPRTPPTDQSFPSWHVAIFVPGPTTKDMERTGRWAGDLTRAVCWAPECKTLSELRHMSDMDVGWCWEVCENRWRTSRFLRHSQDQIKVGDKVRVTVSVWSLVGDETEVEDQNWLDICLARWASVNEMRCYRFAFCVPFSCLSNPQYSPIRVLAINPFSISYW